MLAKTKEKDVIDQGFEDSIGFYAFEVSVNTKLVPKEKAWIYTS